MKLGPEPVAIIGVIVAALQAIQELAIPMSTTAHTILLVVITVLGALVARSAVTPV